MDVVKTDNGKVKEVAIYTGTLYQINVSDKEFRNMKIQYLVSSILSTLLFIGSLWQYTEIAKVWYVMLLYIAYLIPLFLMIGATFHLFTISGSFQRERKDKSVDQMKYATLIGCILMVAALIFAIQVLLFRDIVITIYDILVVVSIILNFIIMFLGFFTSRKLTVSEVFNPKTEEWKDK
ncbi:hypothetical protein LJC58_05120 [Lachnospiraceae bacterium OttesenSCG-928-D06]|nr:hypothetical protein [Lachnospiraceae bacterium OttesenSCG-928-D06]